MKQCVFFAVRPQVIWEGGVCVLTVSCARNTGTVHEAAGSDAYQHDAPSVLTDCVGRILPQH
jgi:hypothetical protein